MPDEHPAAAPPSEQPAAAASGGAVGHGPIRLRGQLPRPSATGSTAPGQDPAAAVGPVGHGAIRLRGRVAPEPAPATPEPQPAAADPMDPFEAATIAAREDVRAALAATA
jgi:hypothetical protein